VGHGALGYVSEILQSSLLSYKYLKSSSQTPDTVVGLLRGQALQGELDDIVFLGNQIINPTEKRKSAH